MARARLSTQLAALAAVCAVGAPVAIAIAPPAADGSGSPTTTVRGATVRTPASERATIRVGGAAAVAATSTAQGFLGIATELTTIPAVSGSAADPDTPLVNLLKNLSPGAPFLLRLGGNSGDDSWWPIPGIKQPYLYALTPRWSTDVRALLTSLGGKAILGVTLKVGADINSRIASAEVADFNQYVGASLIDAFELGNEPEFYPLSVVNGQRGIDTIADYGKKFSRVAVGARWGSLAGPSSGSTTLAAQAGHGAERHALAPEAGDGACLCDEGLLGASRTCRCRTSSPAPSIQGLADAIHATVRGGRRPRQAAARGRDQRRLLRG